MSPPHSQLPAIAITSLLLLFLTSFPHTTIAQIPDATPPGSTLEDCGPRLIQLVPCAPFVQGTSSSPAQQCCENIKQLYGQQPGCLCLLFNDTALSSFPINPTLALQLPHLCSLQVDTSTCPGVPSPSTSPVSQASSGTNPTVAASPVVTVKPRTSIMGFGYGRSEATKSKIKVHLLVLAAAVAFLSLEKLPIPL